MKTINIRNEGEWRGNRFYEDAVYGALDEMVTYGSDAALDNIMQPPHALVHDFNIGMQAAAMLCTVRGAAVDHEEAARMRGRYIIQLNRLEKYIEALTHAELGWGLTLRNYDYGSLDLIDAFFGPLEPQVCKECGGAGFVVTQKAAVIERISDKTGKPLKPKVLRERTRKCSTRHLQRGFALPKPKLAWDAKTHQPSIDKDVLGRLAKDRKKASGRLAHAILLRRGLKKSLDAVRQITNAKDGRFHPHFAFGATDTHRVASKRSNMGENTNGQNITKYLRRLILADPGYILVQGDLARAESHILAARSQDSAYIAAHEGDDDTHALVAKMCWPERDWPDDPADWLRYAKTEIFDRTLPRGRLRDVSKVVQHARGRDGSKRTVGQALGTGDLKGQEVIDVFDAAFPGVPQYIAEAWEALKAKGFVECEELGIIRKFYANPANHDTLRDLLAFVLQAPVAYNCHIGFWRVYKHLDTKSFQPGKGDVQLLFHNHDAVIVQVKEEKLGHYLPILDRLMTVPLRIRGRVVELRRDWEAGPNWRDLKGVRA